MAQTRRLVYNSSAPSTEFAQGADIVAQSQAGNYSVVRVSATAWNRGSTGSYDNNGGTHTAAIDGYGQAQHTGTLGLGVPNGAVRWDAVVDVGVGHDGGGWMGGVTLRQTVSGWFNNVQTAYFGGFPRIPIKPSPAGTPTFSNVLPTSVQVSWAASGDNGGSGIDGYLVRYWPNAAGTGAYIDVSQQNNLTRLVTGLTPGQEYRFVIYAHNGAAGNNGYANGSPGAVVRTLSGMWVRVSGVWKRAVPYVKVAGVWKPVSVFIKASGSWKRGG